MLIKSNKKKINIIQNTIRKNNKNRYNKKYNKISIINR